MIRGELTAGNLVVGAILTGVIAYVVRDRLARKGQRKKDLRGQIDGIAKLLEEIEEQALTYYLSEPTADINRIGAQIKARVTHLSQSVGWIHKSPEGGLCPGESAISRMVAFRKAVTGGDFESARRVPIPPTDPALSEITRTSIALKDLLERIYSKVG